MNEKTRSTDAGLGEGMREPATELGGRHAVMGMAVTWECLLCTRSVHSKSASAECGHERTPGGQSRSFRGLRGSGFLCEISQVARLAHYYSPCFFRCFQ